MLRLPISDTEALLLISLLTIWAALLFGGMLFGKLNAARTHRMPRWTRLGSSFVLVLAAWLWFVIARGTPLGVLSTGVAIGMTLCFVGDVFMAQVDRERRYLLYGMLTFAFGQVAYIVGMLLVALPHNIPYPTLTVYPIWWLIGLVGWWLCVFRGRDRSAVVYVALLYSLLLATTAAFASNLTLLDITFVLVAIGATLFLLSDVVLSLQLFRELHFDHIGDVVWLLYGSGQMLIVFGVIIYTLIWMVNTGSI